MSPETVSPSGVPRADFALLTAPYEEQLADKRSAVARAFERYPELTPVRVSPTVPAEPITGYRTRAKLVADGARLGLYAPGTHDLVDLDVDLLSPRVAAAVAALRQLLPFEFRLQAADVREVDEGSLVTLIVAEDVEDGALRAAATRLTATQPSILGVAVSRKSAGAPRVLGDTPAPLVGARSVSHRLAPEAPFVEATFGSFVQAHAPQAHALYRAVEESLRGTLKELRGAKVLELYAGSGALALQLARAGAHVTAVESYEPAARSIERAARAQALSVEVLATAAEEALEHTMGVRAIVVDPPRRGLSPRVREALARLRPECIVYVSCSPATLARDLAHLARLGWSARSATPFDMIPQTRSVEALVVLERMSGWKPPVIHEAPTFVAVAKPPFLSTTPQGEHEDSLLARVRTGLSIERAVPVHRLDRDTSGICLFARTPDDVEAVARALTNGTKHYVTLLRGIVRPKGAVRRPLRESGKQRDALTRYRREQVVGTHSLVIAMPEQGRQHQIRRHFAGLGHPVLGDARYGDHASNRFFLERHGLDRQFLHLRRLELALDGRSVTLEEPLAPDLSAVLESLEQGHARAERGSA